MSLIRQLLTEGYEDEDDLGSFFNYYIWVPASTTPDQLAEIVADCPLGEPTQTGPHPKLPDVLEVAWTGQDDFTEDMQAWADAKGLDFEDQEEAY